VYAKKPPSWPTSSFSPARSTLGNRLPIICGRCGLAIDEWPRQALARKPSITLDPLKNPATLTVIITRPITL
jgi:hypothetical protein